MASTWGRVGAVVGMPLAAIAWGSGSETAALTSAAVGGVCEGGVLVAVVAGVEGDGPG